jgi:tRNA modification GTPase
MSRPTIFALATGTARAAIAVIRVSGPQANAALQALTGKQHWTARLATRVRLRSPATGVTIDHAIALSFPAPLSYTGEDVIELQVHGGRAVVAATLSALAEIPKLRPAEPGEFTRRAFEAGKLDLTEAEAVADLVAAETEAQRRQALRQLEGELGRLYDGWRERLLRALAHIEADIDFPDEDLPAGLAASVGLEIDSLAGEIARHLADRGCGERLREGVYVAIIGPPNSGKSSLLNLLAGRDAAIVSDRAGTTRDVIEVRMDLGGLPVTLADTAGLRATADAIESEGVRRALERGRAADLKLILLDASAGARLNRELESLLDADSILVLNKIDLMPGATFKSAGYTAHPISATTGAGIAELLKALTQAVAARAAPSGEPALTRLRHRQALEDCRAALERARGAGGVELAAEDMRLAARALGRITGRVGIEEVLDRIFREFCIGK